MKQNVPKELLKETRITQALPHSGMSQKRVKELGLSEVNYVRCNYWRYCGVGL